MSRISGSGTRFEKRIFREIRKRRVHFRKNYSGIIGKPDIARPKFKKAIFLHSDFWHGWQFPRWEKILPNAFWRRKIRKNRKRDRCVIKALRRKGWKVMVLWEHAFNKDQNYWTEKMVRFLR